MKTIHILLAAILAVVTSISLNAIAPSGNQFQTIIVYSMLFAVIFTFVLAKKKELKVIPYSVLTALMAVVITVAVVMVAFWFIYQVSAPYEIKIANFDSFEHKVNVKLYSDSKLLFEKNCTVRPENRVSYGLPKKLIASFPHLLEVTLDGKIRKTYIIRRYGYVSVGILNKNGSLDIYIGQLVPD